MRPNALRFFAGTASFLSIFLFVPPGSLHAQIRARKEVRIPDVPGFAVLACDFHMHTVFSDGRVWPTVRVDEAWLDGLDALCITDHIEYQPHKDDLPVKHDRPYELVASLARDLGLILVRGAEITRKLPPGHFNALFLQDNDPLDKKEWRDSIEAAVRQGAFIFWNHPPFGHPERKSIWYPEHEELYKKGWIHGIEVANGDSYYPEAQRWCLEKGLAMMATSDVHDPLRMVYDVAAGEHRPLTLVLARERSAAAVKEALLARRTVAWWKTNLIGRPEHLGPIFEASREILTPELTLRNKERAILQIRNRSDVTFELEFAGAPKEISAPQRLTLYAGRTARMDVRANSPLRPGKKEIRIPCKVTNLLVAPGEGLAAEIRFAANFVVMGEF